MTESPMEGNSGHHLDEGTIHAWLDGALDAAAAERVAEHVRSCSECSERVAEARGLIAGASRIIGTLDDAPAGARPGWGRDATVSSGEPAAAAPVSSDAANSSVWRWLRVTPARAAIAAALVVAVGITLTHERGVLNGPEASVRATASGPAFDAARSTPAPSPVTAAGAAPDHLLDSAIARKLAIARPDRRVEAAATPAVPVPPAAPPALEAVDTQASTRVAIGRQAIQAQRETTTAVAADRSRAGVAKALTRQDVAGAVAAATRAEPDSRSDLAGAANVQPTDRAAVALTCYRVESTTPNARWARQPLPLVVALDTNRYAGARQARLFSPSGAPLPMSASWSRTPTDSLRVQLRLIGWRGSISVGSESPVRAGLASSGLVGDLAEVTAASRSDSSSSASPNRPVPSSAAPTASAFAKRAERSIPAAQQVPVTLRPTGCPAF